MKPKITHITFEVTNVDETIGFYREYCGMEIIRDRRTEGGNTVWLGWQGKDRPDFVFVIARGEPVTKLDHLGFQVDERGELDQIAEHAKKQNCLYEGPEDVGGSVGSYVMLRDPSGHLVEFTHGQPLTGIRS